MEVRRLNANLRWVQRHALSLTYHPMKCAGHVEVHSDSGFRKGDNDAVDVGRAVRGVNFLRVADPPFTPAVPS